MQLWQLMFYGLKVSIQVPVTFQKSEIKWTIFVAIRCTQKKA
jgi:hypothetical protein